MHSDSTVQENQILNSQDLILEPGLWDVSKISNVFYSVHSVNPSEHSNGEDKKSGYTFLLNNGLNYIGSSS